MLVQNPQQTVTHQEAVLCSPVIYTNACASSCAGRGARRGGANVLFCPVERKYPLIRIHTRQVRRIGVVPMLMAGVRNLQAGRSVCCRGLCQAAV